MKRSYSLKRANIEILNAWGTKSTSKDIFTHIAMCKKELLRLKSIGIPNDSQSIDLISTRQNLRHLREKLKGLKLKTEGYIFNVYVKQYNKSVEIEYKLPAFELGPDRRKAFKEMMKEIVDRAIHSIRINNKYEPNLQKFSGLPKHFHGNKKVGRVFAKEGEVLKIYVARNIQSLYEDKTPKESKKYIGIELEFCAPIKEQEFALKLFRSGIHKFAQLKKDGSLRPHEDKKENGYELAILLEESNYKKKLKQITDLLVEVKAVTKDRRAGLHVHLDMRRRNKDLVFNNLVACQYALLSIVDPQRYNNEFCRVVDSRKFPTEFTGQREERYKTINAAAFYKYKTIEVRMHEGSIDYVQISNWVDLLVKIANYSKKLKNTVAKVTMLNKRINLNKKLFNYLKDRSCFWQVQNSDNTRNLREVLNDVQVTMNEMERPRIEISPSGASGGSNGLSWASPPLTVNQFLTLDAVTGSVGLRPRPIAPGAFINNEEE
jgi:hypothetical protein